MQIVDTVPGPSGHLSLKIYRCGQLIDVFSEKNLIVDTAKSLLANLIGGKVQGKSISTIGFGTNGSPPVNSNTSLTNPFTKGLDSVTFPAANQVSFNFSLASSEANGTQIMEFALLSADGTMFSRRVRNSPLNKDSDISLTGSWVISF